MEHFEIERKYLIRMPARELLETLPSSVIEQIYILGPDGTRERIRRREYHDRCVFTHTSKKRVSDVTRIEKEDEISESEYQKMKDRADPTRQALHKVRYLYDYRGQCFELDVFPFWNDRALLELELESEEQTILFPPDIAVLREVTSDKRYTNAAIAREIPFENEV